MDCDIDNMDLTGMEELLKNLECPFTWDMDRAVTFPCDENKEYKNNDNESDDDYFLFENLIRKLMFSYVDFQKNKDDEKILELLKKCDEILEKLFAYPDPEVSVEVAQYVLKATKCIIYVKLNLLTEAKHILKTIMNKKFTYKKDQSTLAACKGICWSSCHDKDTDEAIKFMREAVRENPQCDLWHFILAQNHRRRRRYLHPKTRILEEERLSFIRAYELRDNPMYETFLAQMYIENREQTKAITLYENALNKQPSDMRILLKLAFGFIQVNNYDKAKLCFEKLKDKNCESCRYYHYLAILFMRQNNYQEAKINLQKFVNDHHKLGAERDLMNCEFKLDKNYCITEHLMQALKKYEHFPESQLQPVFLDLAICFWKKDNNLKAALNNFLRAIEINPRAKCFFNYNDYLEKAEDRNMFSIIKKNFLKDLKHSFIENCNNKEKIDKLEKFCEDYS